MADKTETKYVIDDETQELLETVMNWAQTYVDLQVEDDVHEEMTNTLLELGDRFSITRSNVETTYDIDDKDPNVIKIKIKIPPDNPKVKTPEQVRRMLTVISNDKDDDEPTKH